jgi:pyruvate dehydrogenase E2 component (dihydrolipoamide acetyltransferase)
VPDIGDFKDVAVIEMLVKVGDTVKAEQSLFTVESDKASMEIPSPAAGTIKALKVKLGDKVNVGDVVGQMSVKAPPPAPGCGPGTCRCSPAPAAAAPAAAAAAPCCTGSRRCTRPQPHGGAHGQAAPRIASVRKFARELGVPLAEVKGSGNKGRITADDMQAFTKGVMAGAVQTRPRPRRSRAAPAAARPGPAALAQGRLRQVRPGRAQGPVAHQEDQRRQPAPQLGHDPARHQQRRGRHHRPGSLPRPPTRRTRRAASR